MRTITITKAKLDKERNLTIEFDEQIKDGTQSIVMECTSEPHDDLVKSFQALDKHLAAICDQFTKSGETSAKLECRSFSLSGEDEKRAVVLSGWRTVMETKGFAINTPLIFFLRDSKNYPEMDQLETDLDTCKQEVYKYLVENKHKPDNQLTLEFDATNSKTAKQEEPKKETPKETITPAVDVPENIANQMVAMAAIEVNQVVLVANAGSGIILKSIRATDPSLMVDCVDPNKANRDKLTKSFTCIKVISENILTLDKPKYYDKIIGVPCANYAPDVMKMWDSLRIGGRIVASIPESYINAKDDQGKKFLKWLDVVKAIRQPFDNKTFKHMMIIIDKPAPGKKN